MTAKYVLVLSLAGLALSWVGEQQTSYAGRGSQRYGAICSDGSRSSATGSGACSWHGGVSRWLTTESRVREIRGTWAARNQDVFATAGKVGLLFSALLGFFGLRFDDQATRSARAPRPHPPNPRLTATYVPGKRRDGRSPQPSVPSHPRGDEGGARRSIRIGGDRAQGAPGLRPAHITTTMTHTMDPAAAKKKPAKKKP